MGYFILSLDGGGVRGILSAELVHRLGDALVEKQISSLARRQELSLLNVSSSS